MPTSPFFLQTFRHNGSAVFGTMPLMCRSCPDVNKLRGMDTTILGQHRPFMSIKSFVQHSGWQEMVSLCSLIGLIGVCADRDQPEFLCSHSDSRYLEVHVATAGGWLTRYRPREVRNSINRYRKIHIDYWSKFLYRFISPILIIYGNTNIDKCYWYSSIILPTSAFSFDCSMIKIWHTCSCAGSIMHSTRTFVITVSNDRVTCDPHHEHLAAIVIVIRAPCCLTAADHCYVMLGTLKFDDKSVHDNSAHRLDHCAIAPIRD